MARGWESKSVESQQDEAARSKPAGPRLTAEQRLLEDRRRTLVLSRARAAADLTRATVAQHRRMLQEAIAALDEQITKLDK